ncbi:MAG TPA: DUF3857 domain-containing protein [Sphingomonadaceae bacterium]|nr:DUF3857 domain-containing protein [Sphingomonadaceae bacterium]
MYEVDYDEAVEGPQEILYDWQYRLEDGVVYAYADRLVRVDNPQALMEQGTLALNWLPDNGDLIVHRLEILRGDEEIDLIAQGVTFDVLRRELNLEQRYIDGDLTASLAVPGLQEGDMLRVAYTVSNKERAFGDEVQALQYLPSEPWQVGFSRVIVSWPADDEMYYAAEERVDLPEPVERDGYSFLELALPLDERPSMPFDAPSRYNRPDVLRVGSFADWTEVSRVMAPHFEAAAQVSETSPVAEQARAIMAQTSDPLERMVLATRLVQDKITYLAVGLDGGGYIPQDADETWEKRYGDCKAKSVLLLSLLRRMGIDSQTVLVNIQGGDAVPELLPLPAFNHMIVRATIDGVDYWLDGTSTATRMHNVANVPPFYYALPLTEDGAELVPVTQRTKERADFAMKIDVDHSAGIDLPFLFTIEIEASGPQGAQMRAMADEDNPELLKQLARSFSQGQMSGGIPTGIELEYDEEEAVGRIVVKGVAAADIELENGKVVMSGDAMNLNRRFSPDRARRAWQEIPVWTNGPARNRVEFAVTLPQEADEWNLAGEADIEGEYANTVISRKSSLDDGIFRQVTEIIENLGEVAADRLPEEKRAALKLANSTLKVEAPKDVTWRWELADEERQLRTRAARAAYDKAVDEAEEDDFAALYARASFHSLVFDYESAISDYTTIIDAEPNAGLYLTRAGLFESLGRDEEALADIATAYDLTPSNETAFYQADFLAREDRGGEALALLDDLPVSEAERARYVETRSMVMGFSGDVEGGLALLDQELVTRSEDPGLQNAVCWFRGVFNAAPEDALAHCTKAVELAENPAAALDSRALIKYRLGRYDEALQDVDAALTIAPWLAPTRYLKGVVMLAQGNPEGREIAKTALRQSPSLAERYAQYGIEPVI